jgi:dTDP-4-dehydrorhamnose reductase
VTRWLVTGAGGALGHDLVDLLTRSGETVVGLDHEALDVRDPSAVRAALDAHAPNVVLNAAAYTRVDDAESDEEAATRVNAEGPGFLAGWCAAHGAKLVHVSTDYVFDGSATEPYETDAQTAPLGAYGRSKLAGERAVLSAGGDCHVVRTAWLYGARGSSFIRTVGRRLLAGDSVNVVTDQRGAPTWTRPLAERLIALGASDAPAGTWHCSAAGEASWHDVAVELARLLGIYSTAVRPTTTAAFPRPAARPAYSVLSNRKWIDAGLPAMTDWREALRFALTDGPSTVVS